MKEREQKLYTCFTCGKEHWEPVYDCVGFSLTPIGWHYFWNEDTQRLEYACSDQCAEDLRRYLGVN